MLSFVAPGGNAGLSRQKENLCATPTGVKQEEPVGDSVWLQLGPDTEAEERSRCPADSGLSCRRWGAASQSLSVYTMCSFCPFRRWLDNRKDMVWDTVGKWRHREGPSSWAWICELRDQQYIRTREQGPEAKRQRSGYGANSGPLRSSLHD